MAKKKKSWINQHLNDGWVREANKQGYRSRAAFKLEQLDKQDRLLKPGQTVVDLGATPGGWSQYVARKLGEKGNIIAIDIVSMVDIAGVSFLHGDFNDVEVQKSFAALLNGEKADIVISDMAPNISGVKDKDEAGFSDLFFSILQFVDSNLRSGGNLVVKGFEGVSAGELRKKCKRLFQTVSIRKPEASRDKSRERYLVAKGYFGPNSFRKTN
jgi:23S rRNA (uridine2552-2'-O)-methyltransferase